MKDTYMAIRVPKSTLEWFNDYARRHKTTMSALLRHYLATLRGLEEMEEDERRAQATPAKDKDNAASEADASDGHRFDLPCLVAGKVSQGSGLPISKGEITGI